MPNDQMNMSTTKNPEMQPRKPTPPKHQYSRRKQRKWRKPQDKPKHPLSAYNVFFQFERARMMAEPLRSDEAKKSVSHVTITAKHVSGMVLHQPKLPLSSHTCLPRPKTTDPSRIRELGFAGLARTIADRWKALDATSKSFFEDKARVDKTRYQNELAEWKEKQVSLPLIPPMVSGDEDSFVVELTRKDTSVKDSLCIPNCVTPEKGVMLLEKERCGEIRQKICSGLHHSERTCVINGADVTVPGGGSGYHLPLFATVDSGHITISNDSLSFSSELPPTTWPDQLFAPSLVRSGPYTSSEYPTMSLRLATSLALLKRRQERMHTTADFYDTNTSAFVPMHDMDHHVTLAKYNSFPLHNKGYYEQICPTLPEGLSSNVTFLPNYAGARCDLTRSVVSATFETEEEGDTRSSFTSTTLNSEEDDEDEICMMDPHFDFSSPLHWDENDE